MPGDAAFARWIGAALAALGRDTDRFSLTVRLVDRAEGRALNRQYRGSDRPTNVLAFPAEARPVPELLGDVVICAPLVAEEAAKDGKALDAHYAHLVVHGVLHLAGHEHDSAAGARAMERLEVDILGSLGYSNPYLARPEAGPSPGAAGLSESPRSRMSRG